MCLNKKSWLAIEFVKGAPIQTLIRKWNKQGNKVFYPKVGTSFYYKKLACVCVKDEKSFCSDNSSYWVPVSLSPTSKLIKVSHDDINRMKNFVCYLNSNICNKIEKNVTVFVTKGIWKGICGTLQTILKDDYLIRWMLFGKLLILRVKKNEVKLAA